MISVCKFDYRLIPWIMLVAVLGCDPGPQSGTANSGAAPVTGLSSTVSPGKVDIAWTNPTDPGFAGVRICRSTSGFPEAYSTCKAIYTGKASTFADAEVGNGQVYFYAIWSFDTDGAYSSPITFSPPAIPYPAPTRQTPLTMNLPAFSKSGGEMIEPERLFLTEFGHFLVSDTKRRDVLRVDAVTLRITEALHLDDKPLAVARLGSEVFVGKEEEGSIEIFDSKGAPRGYLVAPGFIGYPGNIDVDASRGMLAVLDGQAGDIRIYSAASRTLLGTFGSGVLINPAGLAVDPAREEILVSNVGDNGSNAFVSIFSYASGNIGTLVATLTSSSCGSFGCSSVGFSRPQGVAVFNGKILLVDALMSQVLVFDRLTLLYQASLGSADPSTRELRLPSDIAVNAAGDVHVISRLRKEIVTFAGGAL